jgi:hypothetical protein
MANPLYQEDYFVVLEPHQPEQILTAAEIFDKLVAILAASSTPLPRDVAHLPTPAEQAKHLLDSSCELKLGPGEFLQWYAIRLEK